MPIRLKSAVFLAFFGLSAVLGAVFPALAAAPPPQAGTPSPWTVEIYQDVTVRAGPGTEYDRVGVLIPGQTSDVIGRTPTGVWLKIVYLGGPDNAGWVLREFVRMVGDDPNLPTIIPPPTPTLPATSTLDFSAIFATDEPTADPAAGRLPTFTAPAPEVRPTLLPAQGVQINTGFPPAILIGVLFTLGAFGGLLTLVRRR
ncbi:MAG: SH3 domain-containing protein [Anaerolineales bacterium]|nr:SH3 domain-containing protein [Anaerolineales bacterium]